MKLSILFQNYLEQTPQISVNRQKNSRGPHKKMHTSAVLEQDFTKLENYIGAGTMDQQESTVHPMNQWGNKESHQVIVSELQKITFLAYISSSTTIIDSGQAQNDKFLSKYLNSMLCPALP